MKRVIGPEEFVGRSSGHSEIAESEATCRLMARWAAGSAYSVSRVECPTRNCNERGRLMALCPGRAPRPFRARNILGASPGQGNAAAGLSPTVAFTRRLAAVPYPGLL